MLSIGGLGCRLRLYLQGVYTHQVSEPVAIQAKVCVKLTLQLRGVPKVPDLWDPFRSQPPLSVTKEREIKLASGIFGKPFFSHMGISVTSTWFT